MDTDGRIAAFYPCSSVFIRGCNSVAAAPRWVHPWLQFGCGCAALGLWGESIPRFGLRRGERVMPASHFVNRPGAVSGGSDLRFTIIYDLRFTNRKPNL